MCSCVFGLPTICLHLNRTRKKKSGCWERMRTLGRLCVASRITARLLEMWAQLRLDWSYYVVRETKLLGVLSLFSSFGHSSGNVSESESEYANGQPAFDGHLLRKDTHTNSFIALKNDDGPLVCGAPRLCKWGANLSLAHSHKTIFAQYVCIAWGVHDDAYHSILNIGAWPSRLAPRAASACT